MGLLTPTQKALEAAPPSTKRREQSHFLKMKRKKPPPPKKKTHKNLIWERLARRRLSVLLGEGEGRKKPEREIARW